MDGKRRAARFEGRNDSTDGDYSDLILTKRLFCGASSARKRDNRHDFPGACPVGLRVIKSLAGAKRVKMAAPLEQREEQRAPAGRQARRPRKTMPSRLRRR